MAATKTAARKGTKPANAKPATKEQPATEAKAGVTVKDLAERLGTNEKSLRSRIRKIKGGTLPKGQTRYGWKSFNDPALVELMKQLKGEKKADKAE